MALLPGRAVRLETDCESISLHPREAAPRLGRTLRILHISDLHARSADGPQKERARRDAAGRWRVLGAEWERNLDALRDDGVPIDVVTFTGDLGDWGDSTDYPLAVAFLRRTCERVGVPIERLFLVPGNHDIARGEASDAWTGLRAGFSGTGRAGSDWMAGGKVPPGLVDGWRDAVATRQQAFWRAVCDDLGRGELAPWRHRHGRLGYQQRVELVGLAAPLWIVGLDTSWLCGGDDDSGKLYLTEHQVGMLTNDDAGAPLDGFRLALMHHRFADLADGERARRLLADRVDLVLHGHQHEAAVEPWASPDHKLLVLAAGCLYEGDEGLRYPNAFQVIDVELTDAGRPVRAAIRFRGWAERNGLFWGDDALLYRNAPGGRLRLVHEDGGWKVEKGPRPGLAFSIPRADSFFGREAELRAIDAGFAAGIGPRVAVVAVQGMPGVGKTFLVEQWCARNGGRFGKVCRWVLDPLRPAEPTVGLLTLAAQAGIDTDRTPVSEIPMRLETMRVLVYVDNVDGEDAARAVAALLRELPRNPAIVTGRYTALGASEGAGWHRVEVACFSPADAVALLRQELGADAPPDGDLRRLAVSVGGLPLALHLAAGYLGRGYAVEAILKHLSDSGLSLEHVDPADPLTADRSRGVISASFAVSKEMLLAEGARRGTNWGPALARLGWTVPEGFESSLGAAFTGLDQDAFVEFISVAAALSLVHRVPRSERRPEGAWSVHPLVAEFLRKENERAGVWTRVGDWIAASGRADDEDRGARWDLLAREQATIAAWLRQAGDDEVARVAPACWQFAISRGPAVPWLARVREVVEATASTDLLWARARLAQRVGINDEVLAAAEHLDARGDDRIRAMAHGLRADVLVARGDLDEALRIRRSEQLPVYERLGEVRQQEITRSKIADILETRGDVDEALRIRLASIPVFERIGDAYSRAVAKGQISRMLAFRGDLDGALQILREDMLPAFERLGAAHEHAVTLGRVVDILAARGEVDEALRIQQGLPLVFEQVGDMRESAVARGKIADLLIAAGHREEALVGLRAILPVFERLGAVHERAVTIGKIADVLVAQGDLDEALRIRREEQLPVYDRLGDVRERAVTMGQIADILEARGEINEALRIRREEQLPVFERLGAARERAVTMGKVADLLAAQGSFDEGLRIRRGLIPVFERLGMRELSVGLFNLGELLRRRGSPEDLAEARQIVSRACDLADTIKLRFPDQWRTWLASDAGR
ncbi:MAG: metallophosphoesterase [Kofleriaceae bacterium]|nr:metallophosphoesterase [Kofleriaceae bacterium]MBP9169859.1 metallophosphoesterase [Kofleriaceae bacterium]MBP9858050.1 metallophosphoesterase [Kofleriaceae bacterium]